MSLAPSLLATRVCLGCQEPHRPLPSPLSQSLLLFSLSLERVKVRGASRERGEEMNTEKPPRPSNSPGVSLAEMVTWFYLNSLIRPSGACLDYGAVLCPGSFLDCGILIWGQAAKSKLRFLPVP